MEIQNADLSGGPRIRRLPDHLINQIAAGEVVERPSSIVKELVENSLDAGATRVGINLVEGGIKEIFILDNGVGIPLADLPLAWERHATSKIREAADLEAIRSFGFRGEALSSIASVSTLVLRTRPADQSFGYEARIEFGALAAPPKPQPMPPGTAITVSDLFDRVPARLKFLRTPTTEFSHCGRILREIALAHPEVSFHLKHDGRSVYRFVNHDPALRFREVMRVAWDPVVIEEEADGMHLTAYLSPADRAEDRGELVVFINARPVKNRGLLSAVRQAYGEFSSGRHSPSGALYLRIRHDWVDVNVHPQKLEVRCLKQESLFGWIVAVLRKRLSQPAPSPAPATYAFENLVEKSSPAPPPTRAPVQSYGPPAAMTPGVRESFAVEKTYEAPKVRYLGRSRWGALICEDARGLLLLNPHLADEFLKYRTLRREWESGQVGRRPLSPALIVKLDRDQAPRLLSQLEFFQRLGFEIEPFGEWDIAVKSAPTILGDKTAAECLTQLLNSLTNDAKSPTPEFFLGKLACLVAFGRNDEIPYARILDWIKDLGDFEAQPNCPHGNPIWFRIGNETLESYFKTS